MKSFGRARAGWDGSYSPTIWRPARRHGHFYYRLKNFPCATANGHDPSGEAE